MIDMFHHLVTLAYCELGIEQQTSVTFWMIRESSFTLDHSNEKFDS